MSVRELIKKSRPRVHACETSVGTMYVKGLSGASRQQYSELSKDGTLPLHTIAALALCEEDGSMLFDLSSDKGVAIANTELKEMDGVDLQAICLTLFEVSGLAKDSASNAEKKSEASPSE
jgi:hypothetical protein